VVTVMALRWFSEQQCDLVIWETGLGGRLDATNIVTPLASVITNIGFDHQQWLGDSLDKIAAEKAGIIKPGVPVITAATPGRGLEVIAETAQRAGAPLTVVGQATRLPQSPTGDPPVGPALPNGPAGESPAGLTQTRSSAPLQLPLPGEHQRLNAAVAVATVRALAKQLGVELHDVRPTGPTGRITAEDVARAAGAGGEPLSATRRTIARNLERAAAIPQVTTFRTLDCTELEQLRDELGVSPLPIFVAALAKTCADHPSLNATWMHNEIRTHEDVDVGIAVDTDRGLVVPVLRRAQTRSIADVAGEITRLAYASRDGSLTPSDMTGATITVSNTGSYGSEAGTPLLNPPCAVTVALGVIAPRALVVEGEVRARPAATISLTFDHRVLDGAAAGRGLTDLVALLQARIPELPR